MYYDTENEFSHSFTEAVSQVELRVDSEIDSLGIDPFETMSDQFVAEIDAWARQALLSSGFGG